MPGRPYANSCAASCVSKTELLPGALDGNIAIFARSAGLHHNFTQFQGSWVCRQHGLLAVVLEKSMCYHC